MASAKARASRQKVRCEWPGNPGRYWWINTADAYSLEADGLAEWAWEGRWLIVASNRSDIRGESCKLNGGAAGHEVKTEMVQTVASVDSNGNPDAWREERVAVLDKQGNPVLEPRLSNLERFALDPKKLEALGEQHLHVLNERLGRVPLPGMRFVNQVSAG
jgi:hypothetical protein